MGIEPLDSNELVIKDELKKFEEIARKDYGVKLTNKELSSKTVR